MHTSDKSISYFSSKIKEPREFRVGKASFVQYKRGLIEKDYIIGKVIGSGAFATVRKVISKTNQKPRALKIIRKTEGDHDDNIRLEVDILKGILHPNIMQVFEFYEDKKNFYIITEFCEGGDLFDKVIEQGYLSEIIAASIMKQLLSAVFYIHKKNIVHRDLKPENILLDTKKDNVIKIIDWGTACYYTESNKLNQFSGTPYYVAPEVIAKKYDNKCDVWSCGVIMYALFCGYPPFNGDTDEDILKAITKGQFSYPKEEWDGVSLLAKDLVNRLLTYDPSKRITAEEACNHPWLMENIEIEVDSRFSTFCLKNMKKFHAKRKLQKASLTYIVNNLISKEDKNALMDLFHQIDVNGDGVLTREEIINGYKLIMPFDDIENNIDEILNEVDIDKNGTIDYSEFVMATLNKKFLLNEEIIDSTFKMFDRDGSGSISLLELKQALGKTVDYNSISDMIKEFDVNGDGEISLEEFRLMMRKLMDKPSLV